MVDRRNHVPIKANRPQTAAAQGMAPRRPPVDAESVGNGVAKDIGMLAGFKAATSTLLKRLRLSNLAGLQFSDKRDLYAVFGYKKFLESDHFLAKYVRQDIASRIVDAPPGATWSNPPAVTSGREEGGEPLGQWQELVEAKDLWNVMYRADRLSRMNYFAVILFGFDDRAKLEAPIQPGSVKKLLYARPIGSRLVSEVQLNTDVKDERYGLPEAYRINVDDPLQKSIVTDQVTVKGVKELIVHHSRIVHLAENTLEDPIFGVPIMERVYNLLDDLLKVSGGTSETYWLAGRKGLQADIDPDLAFDAADAAALQDEIEDYQHELRRFIRTRGVTMKDLGSDTPNPQEVFDMIISLISGTTGIPRRILLGSEVGELASIQDRANWAERIDERRALYAQPSILKPSIQLLQNVGLVAEGDFFIDWPSAFRVSPLEEGQEMAQVARAVGNLSRQVGNAQPMQITSRVEARKIIGLDGDLTERDLIKPEELEEPEDDDPTDPDEEETEAVGEATRSDERR